LGGREVQTEKKNRKAQKPTPVGAKRKRDPNRVLDDPCATKQKRKKKEVGPGGNQGKKTTRRTKNRDGGFPRKKGSL